MTIEIYTCAQNTSTKHADVSLLFSKDRRILNAMHSERREKKNEKEEFQIRDQKIYQDATSIQNV